MKDEWRPTKGGLSGVYSDDAKGGLSGVYSDDAEGEERKGALKNLPKVNFESAGMPPPPQ